MVNFTYSEMQLVEDHILEQIGLFTKTALGLDVFLMDQPWPSNIKPSVGIRITNYDNSGGSGDTPYIPDGNFFAKTDLRFTVEFFARSGRPMSALAFLIQALGGFQELRHNTLNSKGIGYISCTNATPANTVFDGIETEKRARMFANFNVCIQSIDIPAINPIEKITGSIFTNVIAPNLAPEPPQVLVEGINTKSIIRHAIEQNFTVDFTTT